jgi:hypothetical protein
MSISPVNSGYQLIQKSQDLALEATDEIASANDSSSLEFNKVKENELDVSKSQSTSHESIAKLQQAKTYSQTGANLIQRSNEIIGTILDTHV